MQPGNRIDGFSRADFRLKELVDRIADWFEDQTAFDSASNFAARLTYVEGAFADLRSLLVRELAAQDADRRLAAGQRPAAEEYAPWLDPTACAWLQSRIGRPPSEASESTSMGESLSPSGPELNSLSFDTSPQAVSADADDSSFGHANRRIGAYRLIRELGHGGMGVVYEARHFDIDRPVALKLIKNELAGGESRVRFDRERQILARLEHPNIARLLDGGITANGSPYYVMEYVEGQRIDDWCDKPQLSVRDRVHLVVQLCDAVAAANRAGVVHRDIKPANVLVSNAGTVKVLDFGLAKSLDGEADFTATHQLLGTPGYMAPEQAGGSPGQIGAATDVYGIGATLYRLLTGRPPFVGELGHVVHQVQNAEPVSLRRLNPDVPRDLETICCKCLAKDGRRRYANAAILAADMRQYLDGSPISARPVSRIERTWKWCKRRPLTAGAIAMAAGTTIAMLVFLAATVVLQRSQLRLEKSNRHNIEMLMAGQEAATAEYEKVKVLFDKFDHLFPEKQLVSTPSKAARSQMLQAFQQHFQAAISIWTEVADRFPEEKGFRKHFLERMLDLGRVFRLEGNEKEMEAAWEVGLGHIVKLAELTDLDVEQTYTATRLCFNLGLRAFDDRRFERSRELNRQSLELAYSRFDPSIENQKPDFKWYIVTGECQLGKSLIRLGEPAEAIGHLEKAIPYARDGYLRVALSARAIAWASTGRQREAIQAVEAMVKGDPKNFEMHLYAAEVFAVAAEAASEPERSTLLNRALTHLQLCIANGILDDESFLKDIQLLKPFAPLRQRPELTRLLRSKPNMP